MNDITWTPKHPEQSKMYAFKTHIEAKYEVSLADYQALHSWSVEHIESFWQELALFFEVSFTTPATSILKQTNGDMFGARWFEGATLNVGEHLLKRRDDHPALVVIDETGRREVITYQSLFEEVSACAAGLKAQGVVEGDRIAGILPNSEFAIIAMLACASIGAIWSSCSPDFGIKALRDRLSQIEPKVLFICDGYHYHGKAFHLEEKAQELINTLPSIEKLILCPVLQATWQVEKSLTWDAFLQRGEALTFKAFPFDHPWYILFSSGTTGVPKCIVHGTGGVLLQHYKELALHSNLSAEDKLLFHTTCGWMMWNWMVSGLLLGMTLVLYDGSPLYPDASRLFNILAEEEVTAFGTGARFLAATEKRNVTPNEHLDLSALKTIFSTGSPLLPHQFDYIHNHIHQEIQVSSISGGTDIVSCFALGNPLMPVYRGELQCLGLGLDVKIFDEHAQSMVDETGELVCVQPFPCMPLSFWKDEKNLKYKQAYFDTYEGVWAHGDMAKITKHGGLVIYGRSDATLNPGGVRIGTAEIYRPLEHIPEVIDSIVIGQPWHGDVRIILFVKLKPSTTLDRSLIASIKHTIREQASPRHVPAIILEVPDIPRTINGKLVEVAVRQTIEGLPVKNLGSLENPEALEHFKHRPELELEQ